MGFDNVNVNVCGGQSIIKALQNYNTVILKPNIVDNRNVLTQEMMSERHTKYVIKWNYSLEDATINVPKDCIIEFAGGTIDNGTIVGDNTIMIYNKPIDEVCPAERQGTFIYNTTVADEEDITSASGQLKFKDRPATNGMGRKILRKNIVSGVNTLNQSMINKVNTIYVIQYDFDLGENITVPENCVLEFEGGSISGAFTIVGQNTGIEAGLVKIFGTNVTLNGRWAVDEYHPEWFGAVTDDVNCDCTDAINKTIIAAGNSYGGIVRLVQGVYYFSGQIELNHKTSIIGSGIGVSILKQTAASVNHGIRVTARYGGMKLADFSIRGSYTFSGTYNFGVTHFGYGIYIEKRPDRPFPNPDQTDGEQKQYAYTEVNDTNDHNYVRGFKYMLIENVYVGGFNVGGYFGFGAFDVFVSHCTFLENYNHGVVWALTDSDIHDCYINNNGGCGLFVVNGAGASKFSNLKVIFNGLRSLTSARDSAGIALLSGSSYCTFVNCETQDNMCKGWEIASTCSDFIGCWSDTDGHINDGSHGYRKGYNIYGFYIKENEQKTNKFVGCFVTNRDDVTKYDTPVKMDNPYPEIYEGIRINTSVLRHMFVEPIYINDYSSLSHNIGNINSIIKKAHGVHIAGSGEQEDDYKINYLNFVDKTAIGQEIVIPDDIYIYAAIRFDENLRIMSEDEGKRQMIDFGSFKIGFRKTSSGADIRYYYGSTYQGLGFVSALNDYLVTLLVKKNGNNVTVYKCAKDLSVNDNIIIRYDFETEESNNIISNILVNACINKLVVTHRPIDPTYVICGSDLSNFRSDALVYISADTPISNVLHGSPISGTFADKPTVAKNSIPVGFRYFCSDKQTAEGATNGIEIIHKGSDVWVDALGRVIS